MYHIYCIAIKYTFPTGGFAAEWMASEEMMQEPTKNEVDTCANSVLGQEYLHDIGIETKGLYPAVNFIPRITFNGVK